MKSVRFDIILGFCEMLCNAIKSIDYLSYVFSLVCAFVLKRFEQFDNILFAF